MLHDRVARGDFQDLRSLKAEFRRLSLTLHPDTPGGSNEAFVLLKEDYVKAEARLASQASVAVAKTFDTLELCRLLRLAHAKGLPSSSLRNRPAQKALRLKIVRLAALKSAELAKSVDAYFAGAALSPGFTAGLNSFLDTMLIHNGGGSGQWRAIGSYLREVPANSALHHFVAWIEATKPLA